MHTITGSDGKILGVQLDANTTLSRDGHPHSGDRIYAVTVLVGGRTADDVVAEMEARLKAVLDRVGCCRAVGRAGWDVPDMAQFPPESRELAHYILRQAARRQKRIKIIRVWLDLEPQ
jgi:hypothetical protein